MEVVKAAKSITVNEANLQIRFVLFSWAWLNQKGETDQYLLFPSSRPPSVKTPLIDNGPGFVV